MNELRKIELEEIEQKEDFEMENINSANWALRKMQAIKIKEREVKALMNEEITRIKDWGNSELKSLEDSNNFFEGLLMKYYVEQKKIDPKFKISTPYGKVSSRKQQPKWIYNDEKAIESLKENNVKEFIRVKEELDKVNLKKEVQVLNNVFIENGEINENIDFLGDSTGIFIDKSNGLIIDTDIERKIEFYEEVILYKGKVIEGIKVEERPEKINIKVAE
ncbi:host-nuclease inhibitor Gam family protein [Senegalia massiliensis]|uniref:Uncharacterized protein n=1 Tax=Senegalia massiliensis TaxID=1720316 RepID=A0A845QUS6_9CLOT|nr:host-nuclease inhibitor Gam family protein [Senegalia massiliensis]NBI05790.1 hypothetical protein [Senegalia massiliensis]